MKFDKNKAFPYPVLRPQSDDYIDGDFQATADFEVSKDKINAKFSYVISCNEIVNEIAKGRAQYISTISCRDTYFQKAVSSGSNNATAKFADGELRGEVRVNAYVVVRKSIPKFSSPDINPEFGSGPFPFATGDILAQDDTHVVYIEREVFKPVTSVFDLVKKDDQSDGVWTIGFDDEHVQIEVSPKMKESIDNARNAHNNRVILLNSIYFAAVMQAIQKLQDSETRETFEERTWAKVVIAQANNKGIDLGNDAYLVAEQLMHYPLKKLDTYIFGSGISNES